MLVSKGNAIGIIFIWVTYSALRVMVISRTEFLPRAISESMVLLQLGSVLNFQYHVTTGVHINQDVEI